jgi:hypothetical protein
MVEKKGKTRGRKKGMQAILFANYKNNKILHSNATQMT